MAMLVTVAALWAQPLHAQAPGPESADTLRPQLDDATAARLTQADYLGDWQPPPLGDPATWTPRWIVAADGSGTHRTVQAAIDAVPARGTTAERTYILIKPGTYREPLCAQGRAPFTLYGLGEPSEVRLVEGRYNALPKAVSAPAHPCLPQPGETTHGTPGSASVVLLTDDVQLTRLTIANDAMDAVRDGRGYPPGVSESGGAQAVALMTRGDRLQLEQVHLIGHQDTFYAERASDSPSRVLVRRSEIHGDVDFIFGGATLVIDESLLLSRAGRRTPGHGGHVIAPSTPQAVAHGFLIERSRWLAEPGVAPASVSLGRAWDRGVAKGAWAPAPDVPNGQALLRGNLLGPHLAPWAASTSRRAATPHGPTAHRLAEHRNFTLPTQAYDALPPGQGWASMDGGTRGGAHARPQHVRLVRDRAGLVEAFSLGAVPKIIAIAGRIDLSADGQGRPMRAEDFRDPAFDAAQFLRTYAPERWGRRDPAGPLEEARQRSARRQAAQVVLRVPSHTTLVGVTPDAGVQGGMLLMERVEQVILRQLHILATDDHFPAWEPRDNGHGEWNADLDAVALREARHVWIDHCTFSGAAGAAEDAAGNADIAFGQRVQRRDGLLDITRRSDLVTISWSVFQHHDKTVLIGSGDQQHEDAGHLRVTLHHNLWTAVKERTPRVRFGQVHVVNNLFIGSAQGPHPFQYSLGVGAQSQLLSEANVWELPASIGPERIVRVLKGDRFEDRGSWLNGAPLDLQRASGLPGPVGWTPPYRWPVDPPAALPPLIRARAGAGRLW